MYVCMYTGDSNLDTDADADTDPEPFSLSLTHTKTHKHTVRPEPRRLATQPLSNVKVMCWLEVEAGSDVVLSGVLVS